MRRCLLLLPVVMLLVACDPRPPIVRTEIGSLAQNLQVREGLAWGDPTDIQPPAEFEGRRWWQVTYAEGQIILVDAESGWARFPGSGYTVRRMATHRPTEATTLMVTEGSWLLVVIPSQIRNEVGLGELEREAARLNALAGQTGLYPLFSVRLDHQGRSALVYGWQSDRGIARDTHIDAWLQVRTTHRDARWVDLLAGDR